MNDEKRERIEQLAQRIELLAADLAGACRVLSVECVEIELADLLLEVRRLEDMTA